jgi:tRNA(Ile)-lysidine synthase
VRLTEVEAALSRRLRPNIAAPVALAYSGGGDSLALLLAAHRWTTRHGRTLLALNVDHRLQSAAEGWAEACADRAGRLGVECRRLAWTGAKPERGVPAAARRARHALLTEAARGAGARVILLGHTADDVLEARAMRAAGGSTPEPREWAPSPAWPEGRGVFLLRPLLSQRRAEIRAWLTAAGETWIDDPANDDLRYARPRARKALAAGVSADTAASIAADASGLALACRTDAGGGFTIARAALTGAELAAARRFLGAACLCAGGGDRPPRGDSLGRLTAMARGGEAFAVGLAGARIEGDGTSVRIVREAGEAARGGLAPCALAPGADLVWDGRFAIRADQAGLTVEALKGLARRLPEAERRRLGELPAAGRGTLPVVMRAGEIVGSPALAEIGGVRFRPLGLERLLAACGATTREP